MRISFSKVLTFFFLLLLILSLFLNLYLYNVLKTKEEKGTFKVIEIIDGDTLILENYHKIRLADVDAPEVNYCLGQEAKSRLAELILGQRVWLTQERRERYERGLALVYLGDILVNQVMAVEGYGRVSSTYTTQAKSLREVARYAREQKLGVYSDKCTQKEPINSACAIKGNIDASRPGKKIYSFPGCGAYTSAVVELDRGEQWFCSEEEAEKLGFVKSKGCYGKIYSFSET